MPPPDGIVAQASAMGIEFEPGDLERLALYLGLLLEANAQLNLTAITEPAAAWERHILDSLTLVAVLSELPEKSWVLDVGSGGGLPGVPLAIAMPGLKFTLLEATGKKCDFLRHALAVLKLSNARVVHDRAEAAAHSERHRERYEAVVARAVGPLATLAELTVPFATIARELEPGAVMNEPGASVGERSPGADAGVAGDDAGQVALDPAVGAMPAVTGGLIALIKGERAEAELAEAKQALYLLHAQHAGTVDTPTGRIVVLSKRRKTPRAYPRPNGEPKRRPLS